MENKDPEFEFQLWGLVSLRIGPDLGAPPPPRFPGILIPEDRLSAVVVATLPPGRRHRRNPIDAEAYGVFRLSEGAMTPGLDTGNLAGRLSDAVAGQAGEFIDSVLAPFASPTAGITGKALRERIGGGSHLRLKSLSINSLDFRLLVPEEDFADSDYDFATEDDDDDDDDDDDEADDGLPAMRIMVTGSSVMQIDGSESLNQTRFMLGGPAPRPMWLKVVVSSTYSVEPPAPKLVMRMEDALDEPMMTLIMPPVFRLLDEITSLTGYRRLGSSTKWTWRGPPEEASSARAGRGGKRRR